MSRGKETKEWIEKEVHSLASETDEAKKSEQVKAYLEFCTLFHHYSAHNAWWLMAQSIERDITPTRFAGIRTWNARNRMVKEGEKAYRVLAPVEKEYTNEKKAEVTVLNPISGEPMVNRETGEVATKTEVTYETVRRVFFKEAPVFELSQTRVIEGKEDLYIPFESVISASGYAERILPLVMDLANSVRPVVEVEDLDGALGNTDYTLIRVLKRLEPATKIEVLLHESAHVLLEHKNRGRGKETRETEAATVAYVASRYLGLDPGGARYLAIWNQDGVAIMKCMDRALKVVTPMLEALEELAQSKTVYLVATAAGAAAEAETAPQAESVYQDYGYEADVRYEEEAEEEQEEPAPPALLTVACPCETSLEVEEGTGATCPNCGRVLDDRGNVLEGPDEEPEEEGPEEEKPKPKRYYSGNLVIEKKVLKAILDQASRYLDAKGMMPILGGVFFQANDGMFQAWATDLEVYGIIKAEAEGEGTLKFVANAKDLKDIVKKLKGNTITLIVREDKIVLTDDVVILELATMPEEDFPLIPGGNYGRVVELSMDDFRRVMAKVLPAASKDDRRPTLQGVLFNFEEGTVVATDSYRLAVCDTGWTAGDIQLLVPASGLTQFLKLKEKSEKVKISCNEDRTHTLFELGNTSLYIRAVEGKFPKYHQFIDGFEDSANLILKVSPDEFLDALESVDYAATVRVRIEKDDIQLSVEERESGISAATGFKAKRAERVNGEDDEDGGDDEPFATAYNLKFLKDGMSSMEGEVEFILQEPLKPALFKCGRFSYLLMPIRL